MTTEEAPTQDLPKGITAHEWQEHPYSPWAVILTCDLKTHDTRRVIAPKNTHLGMFNAREASAVSSAVTAIPELLRAKSDHEHALRWPDETHVDADEILTQVLDKLRDDPEILMGLAIMTERHLAVCGRR